MRPTPTVYADATALGRALAARIAAEIEAAGSDGRRYVLGCPAGRTPMSTYAELARIVADRRLDLSHLVIAMMDEYLTTDPRTGRHRAVDDRLPYSCRRFGREVIVGPLSAAAGRGRGIADDRFWLPDPVGGTGYDRRIAEVGGIDLFILASGASDGHVGFNPPGSPAGSGTRVVRLADSTRRDNLVTFPGPGGVDRIPRYGVTVGIDTIRRQSRSAVLVLHGADKAAAAARIRAADRYDPEWPATVVTECRQPALLIDEAAADGGGRAARAADGGGQHVPPTAAGQHLPPTAEQHMPPTAAEQHSGGRMARIKLAYLGGGSTRAAGTMASFIHGGERFAGSEVVLIDLDPDRLALIKRLADRMAGRAGIDLTITATTDRRAGLADCDALLSSFRPGGFEARALDERIPLKHGVIGQETQGPGGFFMALRSIAVMRDVAEDIAAVCPRVRIFNYTNPVNIVAQAMTGYTDIPTVSLCEGPKIFPIPVARAAGLDPERVTATMVGINHISWSTEHAYDGDDLIPLLRNAYRERRDDPALHPDERRLLQLATTMESVPSWYFLYYYFRDDVLREQQAAPYTRAEDIMREVPTYWRHYAEQADSDDPKLDPARSRGGIHELELAIDAMHAYFNDTGEVLPVNLPNRGGALPGFDEDVVVEVPTRVDATGFTPLPQRPLPHAVRGLVQALAEHQVLAAKAGWDGDSRDGVRALAAHPLVPSLTVAEQLYAEMALAHADHLPERLLPR